MAQLTLTVHHNRTELSRMLARIEDAIQGGEWRDDDYWLTFLSPQQQARLWNPSTEELDAWNAVWGVTPPAESFADQPWDIGSIIESLANSDITHLCLAPMGTDCAMLTWFGEDDLPPALEALLTVFGVRVPITA